MRNLSYTNTKRSLYVITSQDKYNELDVCRNSCYDSHRIAFLLILYLSQRAIQKRSN